MVSAVLLTGHYSCVMNIFQIPMTHKHIVKKMPMFGPRMHLSCFQTIFMLEENVHNGKMALGAELKQEAPIVITVTNAVPIKDFFPG